MPCGEAARLWCERRFLFIHLDEYADLTPPCEAGVGHHNRWQCVTNSGELGKKMPLPMDRQEPSFQQRNPVSSRTPPSSARRFTARYAQRMLLAKSESKSAIQANGRVKLTAC